MKAVVIDIGGTFIKASIMNEKSEILKKWKVPSPVSSEEELLSALYGLIDEYKDEIEGIAISMPGQIDAKKGIAHTGGAFTFIQDTPIKSILEEHYKLPVAVDNDGKCAANAENWVGALKDVENGLVFVIGTGIGGGVIINNQIYRGTHFSAGELSFGLLDFNKDFSFFNITASTCSTTGLLGIYQEIAGKAASDGLEFFELVKNGDEAANETLHKFASYIAKYIFNIQAVIDVETVAIGGGISEQSVLFEVLNEELDKFFAQTVGFPVHKPEIVKCQYGNDANLIGAMKNFLDQHKG